MKTIAIDAVVFRTDLYPRLETNAATVQKYAEDLTVLPPVELNQNNELIDGWHRWTAHKKAGVKEIPCTVTRTASDGELTVSRCCRLALGEFQITEKFSPERWDEPKSSGRKDGSHVFNRGPTRRGTEDG